MYMVREVNVIGSLKKILVDARHDWPTNGAALALLQYCHLSLQETEIFSFIDDNDIKAVMEQFVDQCSSLDAKKHIYETLTIIEICSKKIRSIDRIVVE